MPIVIVVALCLVALCRADTLIHKRSSLPHLPSAMADVEILPSPPQRPTYGD